MPGAAPHSGRFFQILLRLKLVEAVRQEDVGPMLVPTTAAIEASIEKTRRQASEYGYRFVLIRPEA